VGGGKGGRGGGPTEARRKEKRANKGGLETGEGSWVVKMRGLEKKKESAVGRGCGAGQGGKGRAGRWPSRG